MNLQRREEIRELIAEIAQYEELGATLDLESKARDAITELLAHIDALEQTAAERVIARGAVVKPHTFGEIVNQVRDIASQYAGTEQLREQIAYALAPHFERDAGPTPDYTGEGSAWVPPVEARAVVVPESLLHDLAMAAWDEGADAGMVWDPDADPAKRGVVPCAPEEGIAKARDHFARHGSGPGSAFSRALQAIREHSRALRANQGGAAT